MYKLNPVTLAPRDKNNKQTHIYYLKHTMEQAAILKELIEQAKSLNPLDCASYSAYKYVKLIQELLGYVRYTCLDIHKPSEKLVAVTPINKKEIVRFAEPVISSSTSQKQLECGLVSHYMMIPEKLSFHEEIHEVDHHENVVFLAGISHETSITRILQQNNVVKRQNHRLAEAARPMLIFTQAPLFLWAEAIATACYTQNRSIIR
nr:retrovirus-related Pol polyprotein from transposon TNT 1-94 [Tanacetum cinerariifolium]